MRSGRGGQGRSAGECSCVGQPLATWSQRGTGVWAPASGHREGLLHVIDLQGGSLPAWACAHHECERSCPCCERSWTTSLGRGMGRVLEDRESGGAWPWTFPDQAPRDRSHRFVEAQGVTRTPAGCEKCCSFSCSFCLWCQSPGPSGLSVCACGPLERGPFLIWTQPWSRHPPCQRPRPRQIEACFLCLPLTPPHLTPALIFTPILTPPPCPSLPSPTPILPATPA